MLGKKVKGNGNRQAGITIEITLSVALAVVALFLVIGLFSDNLQTMAAGGMQNLFNRDKAAIKTGQDSWIADQTGSQVNVQVVADQGLEYYLSSAQSTIDKYKDRTDLTQAQIEDLAKAITILSVNKGTTSGVYPELRKKYSISIKLVSSGPCITKLVNSGESINYLLPDKTSGTVSVVKNIYSSSFN